MNFVKKLGCASSPWWRQTALLVTWFTGVALVWPMAANAIESDWLYIDFTTSPSQVRYEAATTTTRNIKTKSRTKCELDLIETDPLLKVTSSGGRVAGYRKQADLIGVNGTSSGSPCTQIRDGQDIILTLGTIPTADGQKVIAATIQLFVEKASNIDFTVSGPAPAGSTGTVSAVGSKVCPVGICTITISTDSADSPDLETTFKWTSINIANDFRPTGEAGSVSLSNSEFELTSFVPDGELRCGDTVPPGDGGGTGSFTRLDDEDCTILPYSYDYDGVTSIFLVEKSADDELFLLFEETSAPELITFPPAGSGAQPPTPIAVGGDNPPALISTFLQNVPLSVQWFDDATDRFLFDYCPGAPVNDTAGDLTGWNLPTGFDVEDSAADMSAGAGRLPGFQYGCMIEREIVVLEPTDCSIGSGAANEVCVTVRVKGLAFGDYTRSRIR